MDGKNTAVAQERGLVRSGVVLAMGAAVMCATLWWHETDRSPFLHLAKRFAGEQWFRIDLHERQVGYMYNHAFTDVRGNFVFETTTHFLLNENAPNTITKSMVFSPRHPHPLLEAEYENRLPRRTESTTLTRGDDHYVATIQRDRRETEQRLDWQFNLTDFLGFEFWLDQSQPRPG